MKPGTSEPKPAEAELPAAGETGAATPSGPPSAFPVVGIGASAGGLEALEALVARLTPEGMAFVVVQHLAPGHESALTEILARHATLPVVTIQDGVEVEPNRIYVTPADGELHLEGGTLRMVALEPQHRGVRLGIDAFFRSLAAARGSGAIGVVLSGSGTDGTLGLRAIKDEGGITLVQEPSTAAHPSMPQSAIDAGCADVALGPAEIGDELVRLALHAETTVARPPDAALDAQVRGKIYAMLRGAYGVDFGLYKHTTIERRIQRRMALQRIDRLEDYLEHLQASPAELAVLYSDLLIGVTSFFRDQEPFEVLRTTVFPKLLERKPPDSSLRVWVAGCASGEEAYSVAMVLLEHLGDRASSYRIQIFATDIDERALARARAAVYPYDIATDVSPERLARFFARTDKGYQVVRAVRDLVVFARHNVGKDPPFSRIDLVTCRNVLIYMLPALQRKVLHVFHYALHPDAFLLLGSSETVGDCADLFSLADRKAKLYTRKNAPMTVAFDLALGAATERAEPTPSPLEPRPPVSVLQLADRKVLEQYGPPGVLVSEAFDILQYRGRTGRFFEPTPGVATVNLLKLVRAELLPALRPALQRALSDKTRVISDPVRIWHDRELQVVRLDVTPILQAGPVGSALLVLFNELPETPGAERSESGPPEVDAHVQALERELATTKEYLQSTIEELEAANEELQSSNEELQSSNEELQSTNEELETSKEELQSTNEELVTLNEELQNRMEQLNESNDDLQNLLGSGTGVILLVGMDLRIRRFSSAAERLLQLIPGDVGRPVAYLRTVLKARDIEQLVSEAIERAAVQQQKVRSADGLWYQLRISPYRTADHVLRGAVLELVPATEEGQRQDGDLAGLGPAILASLPLALAVLDDKLRVTWANAPFLDLFDVGADLFGRALEDIWGGRLAQPDVWKLLEDAVAQGRAFERVLTVSPFGVPLTRPMRVSARRLQRDEGAPALTLVSLDEAVDGEG